MKRKTETIVECPACGGSGKWCDYDHCEACGGTGHDRDKCQCAECRECRRWWRKMEVKQIPKPA